MTEILNRTDRNIARAARLLAEGQLVSFGTETVYGLGADARNARAVAAIFEAKGRPHFNPLICHYATAEAAFEHVEASPMALRLADTFWPGPLTMVLPRRVTCSQPSAGRLPPPPPTAPAASAPPRWRMCWPGWRGALPP
jgi:L-threonylcarbamoyladenylate synthase